MFLKIAQLQVYDVSGEYAKKWSNVPMFLFSEMSPAKAEQRPTAGISLIYV